MSPASILAFAAFLCAGGLAFAVPWHERRSVAHWSFAAGMAALAAESLFFGLSADAAVLDTSAYWQMLGMVAMSFLPGIWLFFSLTYRPCSVGWAEGRVWRSGRGVRRQAKAKPSG